MKISQTAFGRVGGREVSLITLENDRGVTAKITNYGGIVTSLIVPDRTGRRADIVCGFDTLDGYFSASYRRNSPYFGCIVGRYAARIKDARFTLGGKVQQLAANDAPNHLHGGVAGFDKRIWDAAIADDLGDSVLRLKLTSPDGDQGYPGTLQVAVEYRLNDRNELRIRYQAQTDRATPLSLTNHTYFNLNGFKDRILDHVLQLSSDRTLVPDETNVPVGGEAPVAGTVCDFNQAKRVGDAFAVLPMGFEHYYVFRPSADPLTKVAEIREETSGRRLEVLTTEPGGLFYTGRYTSDELRREDGTPYGQFRGFCLETSKYPNGPNLSGSPRSILSPENRYEETTVFRLGWD